MVEKKSVRYVKVDQKSVGQRIDNFMLKELGRVPKSLVYRILRRGEVRVNKKRIKPTYRLVLGDEVRIPPLMVPEKGDRPSPSSAFIEVIGRSFLYEDKDMIVIDKPAGAAVHAGDKVAVGVIDAIRAMNEDFKDAQLVHRLDQGTSGCLMIAKHRHALNDLQSQLREGNIQKFYLFLGKGSWPHTLQKVNAPLEKKTISGERMVVVSTTGKSAITLFEVQETLKNASLVQAQLLTGRTHQIRVHAREAGHPIAGDIKYGEVDFNAQCQQYGLDRLFLHASALQFRNAAGKWLNIKSPLPEALTDCLAKMRNREYAS